MRHHRLQATTLTLFLLLVLGVRASAPARTLDMKPHWDDQSPLANPHRGCDNRGSKTIWKGPITHESKP